MTYVAFNVGLWDFYFAFINAAVQRNQQEEYTRIYLLVREKHNATSNDTNNIFNNPQWK